MDLRLGNLLTQFSLLEAREVEAALGVASETGLPVGKVLVMLERISNHTLKAVVEAQWMLKDNLISMDDAKSAMELVRRNGWSFSDALVANHLDAYTTKGARLGELLVSSGQMIEADVDSYLKVSNQSLLPLGRVLILLDRMNVTGLDATLKMQREIRLGNIDTEDGARQLRETLSLTLAGSSEDGFFGHGTNGRDANHGAGNKATGAKGSKKALRDDVENMKLGELLVAAGLISEKEVSIALEIAMANNKLIGEVLTEHCWIKRDVVEQALSMQDEARHKRMTYHEIVEKLRTQATTGAYPVLEADPSDPTTQFEQNLTLYEFLRLTGYMTPNKLSTVITAASQKPKMLAEIAGFSDQGMKQAIKQAVQDSSRFSLLLIKTLPDETDVVTAALKLQRQVNQGTLKLDRSILEFTLMRTTHKMATGA